MRIKTKIDLWVHAIIWASILSMLLNAVVLLPNITPVEQAITAAFTGFMLWIYFGTYYELRDEYLYCRSGPFYEKIAYDNIKSVKLSGSLLSSMALSVKRIEIRQHGKSFYGHHLHLAGKP